MGRDRFILTDRREVEGDVCLADIRIRRCKGCVKCLTETPGKCVIEDDFSPMLDIILGTPELIIRMGQEHGMMPDRVRKAVERLSNVLDAYTDVGGNKPLENRDAKLRSIVLECRSGLPDRMESETIGALKKGPVSEVRFIDARDGAPADETVMQGPRRSERAHTERLGRRGPRSDPSGSPQQPCADHSGAIGSRDRGTAPAGWASG